MIYLTSLTSLFAGITALHGALIFQNYRYSKHYRDPIKLSLIKDEQYLRALHSETLKTVKSFVRTTLIGSFLLGMAWCGGFSLLSSQIQMVVGWLPLSFREFAHDTLFLFALFVSVSSVMKLVDMIGLTHRGQQSGIKKLRQLGKAWLVFLVAIMALISTMEMFAQSWWWGVPLALLVVLMIYFALEGRIFQRIHTYDSVPDSDGLRKWIEELAEKIGFSVKDIVTVPGSCQSDQCLPKKVVIPGLRKKHIIVYNDMLSILSPRQIGALFVREAYISQRFQKGVLAVLICFCIGVMLWIGQYLASDAQLLYSLDLSPNKISSVILVVFGVVGIVNPLISAVIVHPYIRGIERAADRYAAQITSPETLRKAILTPAPLHRQLLNYHPLYVIATQHTLSLVSRVKFLLMMEAEID